MELKSTNEANGFLALRAFFKQQKLKPPKTKNYDFFFEHGQLWIHNKKTGASWSVVDAEGGNSVDGFDFEQVAQGED